MERRPQSSHKSDEQTYDCKRCGTCCRKGGPALHLDDQSMLIDGSIELKSLFTIRQGEPAYDNVTNTVAPATTDIVKIKSVGHGSTTCIFYDSEQSDCSIYAHRPVECRVLNCRDPRELQDIYRQHRITRRHLLADVQGLWELVGGHQRRCDYGLVGALANRIYKNKDTLQAQKDLLEMIRYDTSLREVTIERTRIDPEMLDFLFGRPLQLTIRMFQLKLVRIEGETLIKAL